MPTTGKNLSLYFHIPFCKKKCPYCQFYSLYHREELEKTYLFAIKEHINLYRRVLDQNNIVSIYFGGGTPSLMNPLFFEEILNLIHPNKNIEITLEANPEDITEEKIKNYKNLGINRISLGVQSFDDNLLKILNRNHSSKRSQDAIFEIYADGITNISIDLMYDIMHQTKNSFANTFKILEKLPLSHVSLYNLTFEENTPFYKNKDILSKSIPSEKASLDLLNLAVFELKKMGFNRYEISAFAKKNKKSIHNIGYWKARSFLGFGPSAFSYFENQRFQNIANLKKYQDLLKAKNFPISFSEELKYPNNINELLAINLRMIDGVNIKEFEKKFGSIPLQTIEILKKSPFADFDNDIIKLNEKGLIFYDTLASEII